MSVKRRPATDAFVQGAPDAGTAPDPAPAKDGGVRRGRKRQISVALDDQLLATVDAIAQRQGISRAAAIAQACRRWADIESQ